MQTRLNFHALRKAIESSLVCPAARDAVEQLAVLVPKQKGPSIEHLECALLVEKIVWRFKTCNDARKIGEMIECYFRNFDANYRINGLEQAPEATTAVRSA